MHEATLIGGRYSLLRLLGSGGMGRVYLAHDECLDREVALKVLDAGQAQSGEYAERFRAEAKHASALSHPGVVTVYDFGEDEQDDVLTSYIAMEHVPGGTLKDELGRRGTLAWEEAATVALQVALALESAHESGIVHRDVKPENILLQDAPGSGDEGREAEGYRVKVADFGIAKAVEATVMTQTSIIIGTARYLSPEQASGGTIGPRSDLYGLGVVLFEMLAGRPPFEAEGPIALAMQHLTAEAPSLRALNPEVPEGLAAVTRRLLAKEPSARYASAGDLAGDLRAVLEGRDPEAATFARSGPEAATQVLRPAREGMRVSRRSRRRELAAGLAFMVLVGVLGTVLATNPPAAASPLAAVERWIPQTGSEGVGAAKTPLYEHAPKLPAPPPKEASAATKPPKPADDPAPSPGEPSDVAPKAEVPNAASATSPSPSSASASASATARAPANSAASASASAPASAPADSTAAAPDAGPGTTSGTEARPPGAGSAGEPVSPRAPAREGEPGAGPAAVPSPYVHRGIGHLPGSQGREPAVSSSSPTKVPVVRTPKVHVPR